MFRLRRFLAASLLLGFVSLGASSCLYNSGDRCDPGQTFDPGSGLCVCAAGSNTITGQYGCVACGKHQIAQNDACSCEPGYSMVGTDCQLSPEGLGLACQADTDCTTAPYTSCQTGSGAGYCTNTSCMTTDDCTGGYACNTTSTPSFCEQPPLGEGMSCASSADCTGAATYCETFSAHTCFVPCTVGGDPCFSNEDCCDLSTLSGGIVKAVICVPSGTCHS